MTNTVLYVAATEARATEGSSALGPEMTGFMVEPVVAMEEIRRRAPDAACVVFAETPTTQAGDHLLDVIGACGETPLVLFADSTYGPATARSTDGIEGYVRSDTPAAATHLADEIEWTCAGTPSRSDLEGVRSWPAAIAAADTPKEVRSELLSLSERIQGVDTAALYVSREGRVDAWEGIDDERSEPVVRGLASEALDRENTQRIDDLLERPEIEAESLLYRSTLCVPLGTGEVLALLARTPGVFDTETRDAGVLLGRIGAIGIDRAERGRQAAVTTRRHAALFEDLPIAAVRFAMPDVEPVIRTANEDFYSLFGYEEGDVLDEPLDDVLVPAGFEADVTNVESAIETGEPTQTRARRRTAQEVRDFEVTVLPVGTRGDGFALYKDVTERERRQRKITAQRERLAEVARLVDGLRDPLNLANAYNSAARETGEEEHFNEVDDALEWMGETIDSLVMLTRELEVLTETEPVALHDIARRAWDAVDDKRATLELEDDAIIDSDKARLTEVLEILFGNAVEHATVDGTVTVRVGATDDGFFVEDDGPGIPPDRRSSVFEPGYTTSREGTGYGLNLVKRVANSHDWTIDITKGESGGARFEFSDVESADMSLAADIPK